LLRSTKTSRWQALTEQPVFQWSAIAVTVVVSVAVLLWQLEASLIPAAVDQIVEETPSEFFDEIGEELVNDLPSSGFTPTELSEREQAEIRALFEELRNELGLDKRYSLHLYEWDGEANALALPGAHIVVTDALVQRLGTGQQLKAVLLHEIGHTTLRHVEASILRSSLVGLAGLLLIGDVSYLSLAAVTLSAAVLENAFSREQEFEADAYAARYFLARNEDPEVLASALQRLSDTSKAEDNGWLSTHPSTVERVRVIQKSKR
jgi:Zn-dependent protease with chaperone function